MRISDWSSDVCSSDLYPAELARYKWNRWEFQREHRFVLTALRGPRSTDNPHEYGARYYDLVRDPLWQRQGALSPHIDLKIAPGALQQIAVTIGPLTSGKDRDQVHRLCSRYGQNVRIRMSELQGTIREEVSFGDCRTTSVRRYGLLALAVVPPRRK